MTQGLQFAGTSEKKYSLLYTLPYIILLLTHSVGHFRIITDQTGLALQVEALKVYQALKLGVDMGVGVVGYHLILPLQQ